MYQFGNTSPTLDIQWTVTVKSGSEGHVPVEPGQGAKHSDSGAIASICNAAMVGERMAGTPHFTVTVHQHPPNSC